MTFKEMMNKDLDACLNLTEFGIASTHTYGELTETLTVVFDKSTDMVLERGEYAGSEASLPALTLNTSKASNINSDSLFLIGTVTYGVIEKNHQKDGTTIVYLDVQS